ncbi:MAG: DUF2147 domain-containing protein [Bacteroidia bacterium]
MIYKLFIFLTIILLFSKVSLAQNSNAIAGVWLPEGGKAHVEIQKKGSYYVGEIIWLKEPNDPKTAKPQLDLNNPDSALRNRAVLGLRILSNLKFDNGEWVDGSVYDPDNGKTYSCEVEYLSSDKIKFTGYVGFTWLGRSETWTRVK